MLYIFSSARKISPCISSESPRYFEQPVLTVTVLPPLRVIRCFSIYSSSPAQTDSIPTLSSVRTKSANSSPPYLPQEPFMVLVYFLSAAAISFKTRSPSLCPYVSLMLLKESISINKKYRSSVALSDLILSSRRCKNSRRFEIPVSGSSEISLSSKFIYASR